MNKSYLIFALAVLVFVLVTISHKIKNDAVVSIDADTQRNHLEVNPIDNTDSFKPSSSNTSVTKKPEVKIQPSPVDLSSLNLDSESTFSHIVLKPRFGTQGLLGFEINAGSSAYTLEEFGFVNGDILTHIENTDLRDQDNSISRIIEGYVTAETVILRLNRNNQAVTLEVDMD